MDHSQRQAKVDGIKWYHEFDFGNGLVAKSTIPGVAGHRRIWRFIEHELCGIDFRGKSVLDVGCWDGYWSFFAERQGAAAVLASDDVSQNWSQGNGLQVARELLDSSIEVNQDVSIYDLPKLDRKFDIILCLGVYYHLYAPLHAFAQLRHCCHANTTVILEGDVARCFSTDECRFSWGRSKSEFVPAPQLLQEMLKAAYFENSKTAYLSDFLAKGRPVTRLRNAIHNVRGRVKSHLPVLRTKPMKDRTLLVCQPFQGVNKSHRVRPPFELDRYDDRFNGKRKTRAA